MDLIYHYTTGQHLSNILQDEKLIVSPWEQKNKVKPPSLWLSTNPLWEPSALKAVQMADGRSRLLTKEELSQNWGLYRFVLPFNKEKLCSWLRYKHYSNTPPHVFESMQEIGIEKGGNPSEWYASFHNVPLRNCLRCEIWNGVTWLLHLDFT